VPDTRYGCIHLFVVEALVGRYGLFRSKVCLWVLYWCVVLGRSASRIAEAACRLITGSKIIGLIFHAWSDPLDCGRLIHYIPICCAAAVFVFSMGHIGRGYDTDFVTAVDHFGR
jgi:hypothetical protein